MRRSSVNARVPTPTSSSTPAPDSSPSLGSTPVGYAMDLEKSVDQLPKLERMARLALTIFLAFYGFSILKHPDAGDAVYNIDIPIHEFGHYLFWPLGEFMHVAGGTLFEVLFPAAFLVYFARRRDYHAASVILWWIAENFWNISVYAGDALATELPLLGGGDGPVQHDWNYMLGRFGLLARDQQIAHRIWLTGVILYLIAIGGGLIALTNAPAKSDEPADIQDAA